MAMYIQRLLNGISVGSVYALIAVGFALIFSILKFSNFAHGSLMTVCAYLGYLITSFIPKNSLNSWVFIAVLFVVVVVAGAVVGYFLELFAFRKIRLNSSPPMFYFVSSITMGVMFETIIAIYAGNMWYSYPVNISTIMIRITDKLSVAASDTMMFCISMLSIALLSVLIYKTKFGVALRAVSIDNKTASLMGINVGFVVTMAFVMAGILAGISGMFLGINYTLYPKLGTLVVKGFIASVIGGLGNISGAVVGAICIGVLEVFVTGLVGATFSPVITFSLMLIFLIFRPQGIMGTLTQEKA